MYYNLGPHPPRLWPEDTELLHKLWLELTKRGLGHKLHHRDVVRVALRRLESAIRSGQSNHILDELRKETLQEKQTAEDEAEITE
jgi:hypothetical protein